LTFGSKGKEIAMIERGNTTHGPHVDDQMKHEAQALRQGGRTGHVEEFRETEPAPDDTDSQEIRDALRAGAADPDEDEDSGR
jgi:hypothetical protein